MSASVPTSSTPAAAENSLPAEELRPYPFSNWKVALLAALAALMVFLIGAGLDWVILHENESRRIAISVSDALAALIAGALVFRLLQYERDRRRHLRQRLEVIAEMNHHVRNALQVISLSTYSSADQQHLAAIKESVNRIQWALKEILPKM
jgi:signal transduction histidine kinase